MKGKKILALALMALLSLSLIGCKDVENLPPELVCEVDGELVNLINIDIDNHEDDVVAVRYYHEAGTSFDPAAMLSYLIENKELMAIDYVQTGIAWGNDRDYVDISDDIIIPTFYAKWIDGDANFDGVVDEADEALYGTFETDEDGNLVYADIIQFMIDFPQLFGPNTDPMPFTIEITDADGDTTSVSCMLYFVEAEADAE